MQDDFAALFAYDRWANGRVLDTCRKLTTEQYAMDLPPVAVAGGGVPGWSSVRATIAHIAWVTDHHLRTLTPAPHTAASPAAPHIPTPTEADLATLDDAARLLEHAYRHFDALLPTLTPDRLNTLLTLRGHDPRIGDFSFTLPRWAMLRHIVNHSTYHRGQVASKLKRISEGRIQQPNTDFFFWTIEHTPQQQQHQHQQ